MQKVSLIILCQITEFSFKDQLQKVSMSTTSVWLAAMAAVHHFKKIVNGQDHRQKAYFLTTSALLAAMAVVQ